METIISDDQAILDRIKGKPLDPVAWPLSSPTHRPLVPGRTQMKYTVLLEESDEGFAVSVPGLPGCHSQGETEVEALANIADAIREYLEVVEELAKSAGAKQATVEV